MSAHTEIYEFISSMEIIDTHEHLMRESTWVNSDHDILTEWLTHNFSFDLISAGLDREVLEKVVRNSKKHLVERWKVVSPYWRVASNTGYARSLFLAARDLYGISQINEKTIELLNETFLDRRKRAENGESYYEFVLRQKSKIALAVLDSDLDCDRTFFRSVYRLDHFINPTSREEIKEIAQSFDMEVHSLKDWEEVCRLDLERAFKKNAVALKCAAAYWRSLSFPKASRKEAERAFNEFLTQKAMGDINQYWFKLDIVEARLKSFIDPLFQNYMMHYILQLVHEKGLVYQFHTGLQSGDNILSHSNPEWMIPLFLEYKKVVFDIFHLSYPYQNIVGALAKSFPNVMLNLCLAHALSPEASIRALVEWFEFIPVNKISAFGGDYGFIDGVYGHQFIARENVAIALSKKIKRGVFDLDRAKEIAHLLFIENPNRILGLKS